MIPAEEFRTWTPRMVEYLIYLAEEPWGGPKKAMMRLYPDGKNLDGTPKRRTQVTGLLGLWRRNKAGFAGCEESIRGSPEYAARFLGWIHGPKAAAAVARAIESGGPSGKEKTTDVARAAREMAKKTVEPEAGDLLAKYLGPRLVKDGESKAG